METTPRIGHTPSTSCTSALAAQMPTWALTLLGTFCRQVYAPKATLSCMTEMPTGEITCVGSKPGRHRPRRSEALDAHNQMLYSDAELLSVHTELCSVPAATGMFATLYDYAKLGSIFLNVRRPAAPMQRQLCAYMLPCHLVLSCRSAAGACTCLGCSLSTK